MGTVVTDTLAGRGAPHQRQDKIQLIIKSQKYDVALIIHILVVGSGCVPYSTMHSWQTVQVLLAEVAKFGTVAVH